MNALILLQSVTGESLPVLSDMSSPVNQPEPMRVFDLAVQGGWLMIPILCFLYWLFTFSSND
jgi:hypothetical protein